MPRIFSWFIVDTGPPDLFPSSVFLYLTEKVLRFELVSEYPGEFAKFSAVFLEIQLSWDKAA